MLELLLGIKPPIQCDPRSPLLSGPAYAAQSLFLCVLRNIKSRFSQIIIQFSALKRASARPAKRQDPKNNKQTYFIQIRILKFSAFFVSFHFSSEQEEKESVGMRRNQIVVDYSGDRVDFFSRLFVISPRASWSRRRVEEVLRVTVHHWRVAEEEGFLDIKDKFYVVGVGAANKEREEKKAEEHRKPFFRVLNS